MIPPEQQTTTLKTSRRLEELGVPQESLFYWQKFIDGWRLEYLPMRWTPKFCSAYTVAELGEMLPDSVWKNGEFPLNKSRSQYFLTTQHVGKFWEVGYTHEEKTLDDTTFEAENEAEARGLMLIYLLENKIVSIEDLKGK